MKRREAMRALVLEEFGGPLTLKDMAIPRLHFHEVLVGERHVWLIMGSGVMSLRCNRRMQT